MMVVKVTQSYWNYLDVQGGAYCLVEQTDAVLVNGPVRVTTVIGPVFQQVSQTYVN